MKDWSMNSGTFLCPYNRNIFTLSLLSFSASFLCFCCLFYFFFITVWSYFWSGGLKWWAINGTSSIFVAFFLLFLTFLATFSKLLRQLIFVTHLDTSIASAECECKTTRLLKSRHCDNLPGLVLWQRPRVRALVESSFVLSATVFDFSLCVKWSSDSQSFFSAMAHCGEATDAVCTCFFDDRD